MGTSERRDRHRASLRREILDAASQLFVDEGVQRVTMRRIAAKIEYSPTTIYLHFKDKNALLQAVCEETFSQLAEKLERLKRGAGTPLGRLRETLRTYVEFGVSNPAHYTVTFMRPHPVSGGAPASQAIFGRAFDVLRQAVRGCVESGDIRTADVDMTAQALWAAAHGLTSLFITMPGFPFVARTVLADHAIDAVIGGLKPPAPLRSQAAPRASRSDFFD